MTHERPQKTDSHRDGYRCVQCGAPAQGERGRDWSLQH